MVILGIDPGSVITGYGAVACRGRKRRLVACGSLRPNNKQPFSRRLLEIYDGLLELVADLSPDEVALEGAFYGANVKTLMKMCHARGVILLALANSNLPVYEYSPREVKKAVVGRGGASKEQVQFMVQQIFGMENPPETYDATDAVAIALCHANRGGVSGAGARRKNDLAARLEAVRAEGRHGEGLEEKLKRLGVDAKARQAQSGSNRRGRSQG